MSIFKKALEYLTGKKELQEQINQLKKEAITNQQLISAVQSIEAQKKPCYNKVIYNVNTQSVTVVDCEGNFYSGITTSDVVEKLKTATTEEIIALLTPPKVEEKGSDFDIEKEESEIVKPFLSIFDSVDDFEVVGNSLFFKNIRSVEIPSLVAARFIELIEKHRDPVDEQIQTGYLEEDEEYQSLKAFTLKLLTSPRKESIAQVLSFCRHNDLRISKRGNIIAYRRVREYKDVSMPDNTKLAQFVKESIEKIKKWKKSAKNYEVFNDNGYILAQGEKRHDYNKHIGNLYELYNNQSVLKPEIVKLYSSKHDYGKYTFAIGDVYKANEDDIDVDAGQCNSGGLHFASVNYNYSSYGEIPIVVLINPAKTITIPLNELAKGRTTEMKIACINPNEQGVHIDESLIEEADEQYDEYTLEELQQVISQKTLKPLSVEEEVTNLSIPEVVNIKDLLSKRVVNI